MGELHSDGERKVEGDREGERGKRKEERLAIVAERSKGVCLPA